MHQGGAWRSSKGLSGAGGGGVGLRVGEPQGRCAPRLSPSALCPGRPVACPHGIHWCSVKRGEGALLTIDEAETTNQSSF